MEWKDIPGYEGLYQASDTGLVRSLERMRKTKAGGLCKVKPRILKGTPSTKGYLVVSLFKESKVRFFGIHQLVLMTFVGPCPAGMEACHSPDKSKDNNHLSNLRWDTHAANCEDMRRDGDYATGEQHHASRFTSKQIRRMRELYKQGVKQTEIAKIFKVRQGHVSDIVLEKVWK